MVRKRNVGVEITMLSKKLVVVRLVVAVAATPVNPGGCRTL